MGAAQHSSALLMPFRCSNRILRVNTNTGEVDLIGQCPRKNVQKVACPKKNSFGARIHCPNIYIYIRILYIYIYTTGTTLRIHCPKEFMNVAVFGHTFLLHQAQTWAGGPTSTEQPLLQPTGCLVTHFLHSHSVFHRSCESPFCSIGENLVHRILVVQGSLLPSAFCAMLKLVAVR